MAAASLIAIGKTAAVSVDIAVTAGAPVTVGLLFNPLQPVRGAIAVNLKDSGAVYRQVGVLNNDIRAVTLTGPGTYQLARPTISEANNDGLGAFSG